MMELDTIYRISTNLVLPGWLLLLFLPRWKYTTRLITSVLVPGILAAVYIGLLIAYLRSTESGLGSLFQVAGVADLQRLFQNPYIALAGWVHYLVFDLFIGSWEVRDAHSLAMSHFLLVPCLILTLFFGPIGLLLYLSVRSILRQRLMLE